MSLIPASWLPRVSMKRIICHWTAGAHKANATDKKAYHILIEGDGSVVRGVPSIAANSGKLMDGYAAHTLNCNTDSIGVSMCGMAGAKEYPFDPGKMPLTQVQWNVMVQAVAELAEQYEIPITAKTVLFHAEVEPNLGIKQRNKWDVTRLPFDNSISGAAAIGARLRKEVAAALMQSDEEPLEPMPAGGIAVAIRATTTSSVRNGPRTGSIPAGTTVEVVAVDGFQVNIETPAGYLVWGDRVDFKMLDGPKVEEPTTTGPIRDAITKLRALADELEASLG